MRHAPPWPCHCSAQPLPPAGAAALTLMCLEISLEISLNMDYLFKFENMDYLFRNYVVKYILFVNGALILMTNRVLITFEIILFRVHVI